MLIECPECKNQVSSRATACPKCSAPVKVDVSAKLSTTDNTHTSQNEQSSTQEPDAVLKGIYGKYTAYIAGATIALIAFRIFFIEDFYTLIGDIVAKEKLSSLEYSLGLYTYDVKGLVSNPWFGYIIPWIVFYIIAAGEAIYIAAIIGVIFISAKISGV